MEASAGVLRRYPSITGAGAGIRSNPFEHSCRFSKSSSNSVKLSLGCSSVGKKESRKLIMGCGIYDEGYLEYYCSSGRGVRCGGGGGKKEKDVMVLKKTQKKKMKLLKGLSKDLMSLSEMGFGGGGAGLVDQAQGKTISEAAELLLGQLQQLKAEEKELKRKRKEEKAVMKMKAASQVLQGTRNCEMAASSSSSSSESSESSDDECQNLVDMKSLKIGTLAQTIPEACDQALENAATLSPALSTIVEPQTLNPEADTSVEISTAPSSSTEESTMRKSSLEVVPPEQKGECCMEASDCHIGNIGSRSNASVAAATGTKRIEVCMGGKCKRSGAGAILEELQRVVGMEAAVSGCKCMGKCKVGPNVRLSGCSSSSTSTDAFQAGDSVAVSSAPPTTTTSNSLCIGVGLEDVGLIAANLLGSRYQEIGLANAVP